LTKIGDLPNTEAGRDYIYSLIHFFIPLKTLAVENVTSTYEHRTNWKI